MRTTGRMAQWLETFVPIIACITHLPFVPSHTHRL